MGVQASVESSFNFDGVTAAILAGVVRGENLAAEALLGYSAAEVPLETGALMASGQAIHATDPDEGAAVSYDTPYAARLHEHPEFNFQGGRKGKYLEDPAMEHRDELLRIISAEASNG